MDSTTLKRIKRIRANEGTPWKEIEERTGVPQTTAFYAVNGRQKSQAQIRRESRARKNQELIRTLRATIRSLEARLGLRNSQ